MNVKFTLKPLDPEVKPRWREVRIILFCLGELFLLIALLFLFAYRFAINTWHTLDTMDILYHLSTSTSGTSNEIMNRFIQYCIIPLILVMIAVNYLMFFYARKKVTVDIKTKWKDFPQFTISPQKIKRVLRISLLPVSIFLILITYWVTSSIFDYQFAYQMLTFKPTTTTAFAYDSAYNNSNFNTTNNANNTNTNSSSNSNNDSNITNNNDSGNNDSSGNNSRDNNDDNTNNSADNNANNNTGNNSNNSNLSNNPNNSIDDKPVVPDNFNYSFIHPPRPYEFNDFIEANNIDPRSVDIRFPDRKRNLIHIIVESLESTYFSLEQGGAQPENLMPEMISIMNSNTFFSHNNLYGGGHQLTAGWTIAGMVAQSTGLPLIGLPGNERSASGLFLPGVYSLGRILEDNGYSNTFIMGSDASFAARDDFLNQHGNYRILDWSVAQQQGVIPAGYRVWWGFEDEYLYSWARDEAVSLAAKGTPFNLTLLTADTHHVSGYVCGLCLDEHEEQLANVISCASRQLYDFITWLSTQSFYNNTTIIISGDHRSMDPHFFENVSSNYQRMLPFIVINPTAQASSTYNRLFSTLDIFPTTLAALGVRIEGNRLGLGVNLFSSEATIIEHYTLNTVMAELRKFSAFYMNTFW
ncbi:MAG: LTA synthase family protein [Oscillospiraceae bacterium]|jgi:phosphoglycerol transferase|nr:LTA synthase family protein [Oscillospiraceae bacterium]